MKKSLRLLFAIEVLITLVAMAFLARVLVPVAAGLASKLLTTVAPSAFRSPALALVAIVAGLMLCLAAALISILVPLKVVPVLPAISDYGREQ